MSEAKDIADFLDSNGYFDIFNHVGYDFINRDTQSAIGVFADSGEPTTYINGDYDEVRTINIQLHHYQPETARSRALEIVDFLHTNNFVNSDNTYNYVHIINTALPQKQEILDSGNEILYFNFRITRRKA